MSEQQQGMTASANGHGDAVAEASRTLGAKAGEVAGKAAGIADKATAAVHDTAGLASAAGDLASLAVDQGKTLIGSAREGATSFADRRKDDAAQTVADLATSLRTTGEQFEGRPNIQAFVGSAAEGLEQLASTIRERSFVEIYRDFETYAREKPALVGAAAVAGGFLLARFIKSSADRMSEAAREVSARSTPAAGQTRKASSTTGASADRSAGDNARRSGGDSAGRRAEAGTGKSGA